MTNPIATVKVLKAGLLSTIQDNGRFGLRHLGIPWAGALSPAWQEIANALVGNDSNSSVIECFEGGLQLQACDNDVLVSVVGSETAMVKLDGLTDKTVLPVNRAYTLRAGQSLTLTSTGDLRHAIVALAGVEIPEHLGSTATYAKAALGGIDGSVLGAGQTISINHLTRFTTSTPFVEQRCAQLPEPLRYQSDTLRVICGPQLDHFSEQGVHTFLNMQYTLGSEADRMGVRLQGPIIEHRDAAAKDIVSDAIIPGSIQVPGTGLPIVLLNDAHTAGGYPKIATVISCDLPLLGLQRSGSGFRFSQVSIDDAIAANADLRRLIDSTISALLPCVKSELDSRTLLQSNLIDGVTDGS